MELKAKNSKILSQASELQLNQNNLLKNYYKTQINTLKETINILKRDINEIEKENKQLNNLNYKLKSELFRNEINTLQNNYPKTRLPYSSQMEKHSKNINDTA